MKPLHRDRLADISLGDNQSVDVEIMIVFSVRNGAHHALTDIDSDALGAEFEFSERLVDLLAADHAGNQVELLRRNPQ